jgi:hypothetical protein
MEEQLYRTVYRHVMSIAHPRRPRVIFNDHIIVMVYLWSVLHERPVCWACDALNWSKELSFDLPSNSAMSQRLRTVGVQQLFERALACAADRFPWTLVKAMDSKPVLVGACSKDRDAKRGRIAAGQFARGYRINALTCGRAVRQWILGAMNDHDSVAAPRLLEGLSGSGYLVADNAYDCNALYETAAAADHQLLAPARRVNRGVRDTKHNCPQRLRALDLLDNPLKHCGLKGGFGMKLYHRRETIESCFGELSMMGLNYLPAWARGPRRVALWTAGKILLYMCRLAKKQGLMT